MGFMDFIDNKNYRNMRSFIRNENAICRNAFEIAGITNNFSGMP